MSESTLVGGGADPAGVRFGGVASTGQQTSVQRWQRRLLPSELIEAPGASRSARDWFVDSAVFALAVLIGITNLGTTYGDHDAVTVAGDVLLGTIACLLLWVRRTHPTGIGVFAMVAAPFSAVATGAAPIALFNVALRSSWKALVGVTGLAVAAILTGPLVYPGNSDYWGQVFFGVLVVTIVIGWGLFSRVRRELVLSLRERAERVESEQRLELERAREAERRRIAREMHDVLAHRLSLLSVHAGALEFRPDASPAEITAAAEVIRETAQVALEELREVIGVLRENGERAVPEAPQPTIAQIPSLIDESRAAGLDVTWRDELPEPQIVPGAIARTAYRVVQESLTNARKHAPSGSVEVGISAQGSVLTVEVVSRSESPVDETTLARAGSGKGLVGLMERVDLVGGTLERGPDRKGGFVLRATLPWTP
jgi:signal transduction histidine kinase